MVYSLLYSLDWESANIVITSCVYFGAFNDALDVDEKHLFFFACFLTFLTLLKRQGRAEKGSIQEICTHLAHGVISLDGTRLHEAIRERQGK